MSTLKQFMLYEYEICFLLAALRRDHAACEAQNDGTYGVYYVHAQHDVHLMEIFNPKHTDLRPIAEPACVRSEQA